MSLASSALRTLWRITRDSRRCIPFCACACACVVALAFALRASQSDGKSKSGQLVCGSCGAKAIFHPVRSYMTW